MPRNTVDLDHNGSDFWTKVSWRDIPAADNNNESDDEDDSDATDSDGTFDEDNEIDGGDLLDKRDTTTAEQGDTALGAPVEVDVEDDGKSEAEDQYFTDLYGADNDDIEDEG